jgi:hypothetical protein
MRHTLRRFAIVAGASACLALASAIQAGRGESWFSFDPAPDPFRESPIDLRRLNERFAGEHGRIAVLGEGFVHSANNRPIRFWGVNGLPAGLSSGDTLTSTARRLAKYGVNLVRLHGAMFDKSGDLDAEKLARTLRSVEALKAQGIYSHLSLYFPLWMAPPANHPWLVGYDGKKHPFTALMFNPAFQRHYRDWWRALLLTPNPDTGSRLVDDPAVFGVEMQNEDSFFFWTFDENIPDEQMQILESQFGVWVAARHGTLETALENWGGQKSPRDDLPSGRIGLRPLRSILEGRSSRDRDTVRFLLATQRKFYVETYRFLRSLGFKGLITASNWITASPELFGPLEKWSYGAGDFMDRHGYFAVMHEGEQSSWTIQEGHRFADRSALRFDARVPGGPKQFANPVMEASYEGKPSMISETTWNRPNRFRSEAPLYFAAYGALQDIDAVVHFALDGDRWWSVNAGGWVQPQTLMTPSLAGQFPAAALIFRLGLLKPGTVLARLNLNKQDLLDLKGSRFPAIEPLLHLVGRMNVSFTDAPDKLEIQDLNAFVDRASQSVRSSTGELSLDYGKGLLTLNAASAQGASGDLKAGGVIRLRDISIQSGLDNAHIVMVALDGQPISRSRSLLLQAMSEEKPTGFATEDEGGGVKRITRIGRNPFQVRSLHGRVTSSSLGMLQIQPLDLNGYPKGPAYGAAELDLLPHTNYYHLSRHIIGSQ